MPHDGDHAALSRLLQILLPAGGVVVQLVEAYFDESGTHDNSPIMCVAGYVIEANKCISMDSEWGKVLAEYKLPYFRMSACAHGNEPFDNLSAEECIECEKKMIAIIKGHVEYGFAVSVNEASYNRIMPKNDNLGGAYSFCARMCLVAVRSAWCDAQNFYGDVAYFFESGHRSQSEANAIMNQLFTNEEKRGQYRYLSHTFADKRKIQPLQAADILAWQWCTDIKRRASGKHLPPRKDMASLTETRNYRFWHGSDEALIDMASQGLFPSL